MSGAVVALRPGGDAAAAADRALAAVSRYLDRCKLAPATVKVYRRQCAAYVTWLAGHADAHPGPGSATRWRDAVER